jgi:transposase-like protein
VPRIFLRAPNSSLALGLYQSKGKQLTCPYCHSDQVIKGGHTETGKQRYRCQQTTCSHCSFVLEPAYNGRLPHVKEQIIDMALNGSGAQGEG